MWAHLFAEKIRGTFALQKFLSFFSSSGQSPGRAIVLPPVSVLAAASALAKSLTLKFFM